MEDEEIVNFDEVVNTLVEFKLKYLFESNI